jgi:signal transduction histidine kinase
MWVALFAAVAALAHGTYTIGVRGSSAFDIQGWARVDFFLTSSWPALALTPLFVLAYHRGSQVRYRDCGLLLAWGVLLFGLVLLIPRGVYAPGWYLQPVLVLLVTCMFGAVAGVCQASVVVAALLLAATLTSPVDLVTIPNVWTQVGFAGAATVLMAVLGSLLQRTLDLAISAEEDQSVRMDEARRALRHRENLLRHAMRVDTVGQVASMVVHQLRNQFQLIMGYAAVGRRSADDQTIEYFRAIVDTLGQSNDLLEGLLGISRSESGKVDRVDLAALCRQVCESYQRVLPSGIELKLDAPDDAVPVHLDPQGLEHALLNLVINARQAMTGDGEIRMRLTRIGGAASLEVEDTGSGIATEVIDEIFKPFFTTKKKGEGTGLGLAAVHRFVVASRGEISVASGPGSGTLFTLTFPLLDGLPDENDADVATA